MIDLAQRIRSMRVPSGQVLYVDAYLSDSVERKFGQSWKRIMPAPIAAQDVACDYFLSTHEHDDHLDVDAIPIIARGTKACFGGPRECAAFYRTLELPEERFFELAPGMSQDLGGVVLSVVYADHGDLAPDAVGLVFDFGSIKIYHTGDTAFRPDRMDGVRRMRPDVILPCINPAYGNLGAKNAAALADFSGAKIAIPTHFWTFAEHGGDPQAFLNACEQYAPQVSVRLMTQGEGIIL